MRIRIAVYGVSLMFALSLAFEASAQAVAQEATKPAQEMAAKPKAKPKRKKSPRMAGVPRGVPACLKHLSDMAEKDPLIAYEGHPSEIINNGLLWNSPKSKCSIGADETMRKKVFEVGVAWRTKDAAKVRSLIAELQASAGSSQ